MKGGKEGGRRKLERISEYCSVEDIYMELYGTQERFEEKILFCQMKDIPLPFTTSPLPAQILLA